MKTAMQELINYLDNNSLISKQVLINKCKDLLEIEKKQIIDAYYGGTAQFDNSAPITYPKTPIDYYNEKYATNKVIWVCNECNFENFTSSVSEQEIEMELHACINCGGFEFHKKTITP